MKRRQHRNSKPHANKKGYRKSISKRPKIAALRTEEDHWKGDTVEGKRAGKEAVISFPIGEENSYIALHIPGQDVDSVLHAMQNLRNEYGDKYNAFLTIFNI